MKLRDYGFWAECYWKLPNSYHRERKVLPVQNLRCIWEIVSSKRFSAMYVFKNSLDIVTIFAAGSMAALYSTYASGSTAAPEMSVVRADYNDFCDKWVSVLGPASIERS